MNVFNWMIVGKSKCYLIFFTSDISLVLDYGMVKKLVLSSKTIEYEPQINKREENRLSPWVDM